MAHDAEIRECLSAEQIEQYASGQMSREDRMRLNKHIVSCSRCKAALWNTPRLAYGASTVLSGMEDKSACPSYETLVGYVQERLSTEQLAQVEGHLRVCNPCARIVADIRELERQAGGRQVDRQVRPLALLRLLYAAVPLALAAVVAVLVLRPAENPVPDQLVGRQSDSPSITAPGPTTTDGSDAQPDATTSAANEPTAQKPGSPDPVQGGGPAVIRDGEYTVIVSERFVKVKQRTSGRIVPLPMTIEAAITRKLTTGMARMKSPLGIPTPYAPYDDGPRRQITHRQPAGINVVSQSPTLTWNAPSEIDSFTIRILDADSKPVMDPITVGSREYKVARTLSRGRVYWWVLGLHADSGVMYTQAVPFRVLSEEEYQSLTQALGKYPDSQFVRGVVYESYGAYQDALREYEALLQHNPDSVEAQRLVDGLKKAISRAWS